MVGAELGHLYLGFRRLLKSMGTRPIAVPAYSKTSIFRLFFISSRYFWKFRIGQRISYSCSFGKVGFVVF